jgi:hypothetical protein
MAVTDSAATDDRRPEIVGVLPNGHAAAAILAAGIGCFALGVFALVGDASRTIARLFTFYRPTGPLSGVTTSAIVIWLLTWIVLTSRWGGKTVGIAKINWATFILLTLGILLTFPPFMDLLQGK